MKVAHFLKFLIVGIYLVCALALAVFMLPFSGLAAKTVATGSMSPAIPTGSLVIIQAVTPDAIAVGDVVTYKDPRNLRRTITHRVVKRQVEQNVVFFTTKGDANAVADPRIASGAVVGKVMIHVPYAGKIIDLVKSPIGLALLVVIPGLWIIWDETRRLKRMLKTPNTPEIEPSKQAVEATTTTFTRPSSVPKGSAAKPTSRPPVRRIRLGVAALLVGIGCIGASDQTYSNFRTNSTSVSNINLAVITPKPTPAVHITTTSNTTITIQNTNNQTATTGSISNH